MVPFQTEDSFVWLGWMQEGAAICVCVHLTLLPGDEKAGRGRWGRWPEGSSGVSSIHVQSRDPGQRISSELEWLLRAIPDFFRDAAHLKVGY